MSLAAQASQEWLCPPPPSSWSSTQLFTPPLVASLTNPEAAVQGHFCEGMALFRALLLPANEEGDPAASATSQGPLDHSLAFLNSLCGARAHTSAGWLSSFATTPYFQGLSCSLACSEMTCPPREFLSRQVAQSRLPCHF